MHERRARRRPEWLRWACLGAAALALGVFVVAQRQSIDVSYGRSPSSSDGVQEGSAGELSDATVPPVDEMTAMLRANDVVRLPGSIARWDTRRVRAAIGGRDVRILVAPPGLDEAERDRVRDVDNATIRVIGLRVTGDVYQATADSLPGWRSQFATGDVTSLLLTMIAGLHDEPSPPDVDLLRWREPAAAEIGRVAAALRERGTYVGEGATVTRVPAERARSALPGGALFVVLPQQPFTAALPRFGPALTRLFPGRPIVVQYGSWIEYHGPRAAGFAEVAAASFYAQFGDRLSTYAYPQSAVLGAYLDRVTDVRYAGLFDRPLPYQPPDPLRVALPALPWVFAGCVAVFVVLSVRPGRRSSVVAERRGSPARLAGLTALAVEVSALTDGPSDAALTRAITALTAAREALGRRLAEPHVHALLDQAEAELADTARLLGRKDYRPDVYLRGALA
ncbi:hypothetical protein [Prauserella muralis]|uniref:Uncharacterized protein n=1 Tax=Prauserella muralis TaxID=588067 RepID=A0A2V4AHI7_9PSEU|nr:hypothetical protein [Prauserella muralis]PXY19384.1 hypothetical protein BAY60_32055 [Prauserella muralis]TWE29351.1 hypothetical protein FHX69_2035 [Prauserella muralis]